MSWGEWMVVAFCCAAFCWMGWQILRVPYVNKWGVPDAPPEDAPAEPVQ
jgi:hypothetical protein